MSSKKRLMSLFAVAVIAGGVSLSVVAKEENERAERGEKGEKGEKAEHGEDDEKGEDEEHGEEGEYGSIAVDELPAAVRATIAKYAPGGTIEEAATEEEDDVDVFEVEVEMEGDVDVELTILPDGGLVEIEEEVAESALPAAVAQTLADLLPGGKLEEAEKKLVVVYEIKKEIGETTYEILIDAMGNVLSIEMEHESEEAGEGSEKD